MKIFFILVEPYHPENVGAAARAIKTMGFDNLFLVNPRNHLDESAKWMAHGSIDILEKAKIFSTFESAINDIDFIIGTTSKKRKINYDYYDCNEVLQIINNKLNSISSIAVVFGREDRGLSNDELKLCNIISSIPIAVKYPSLNLSQTVMIYAYTLSSLFDKKTADAKKNISNSETVQLKKKIETILKNLDFKQESNIYNRIFERLEVIGDSDINLLHSICNKLCDKF
ncbi:MAG: tRNA/rRNA methyltransferase [Bacteroidales bacterium]|nr:tRNA/rRNA methyltransferase [Bacteroidales bacterium]